MRFEKKYYLFYIIIIVTILVAIGYLFFLINGAKEELNKNIQNKFIQNAKYLSINVVKLIKNKVPNNLYETLKNNPALKKELEDALSLLITPTIKYAYVLYKDKKEKYRYLLDGSIIDKGEFNEPLSVDKLKWNSVYKDKKNKILLQKNLQSLYGTFLQPIIYDDKVEAILAIDFSTKLPRSVNQIIEPVKITFTYIVIALAIIIIVLVWQMIHNFKTKKSSIIDNLTKLYNRNYLHEIKPLINLQNYSIAMLDLDKFKYINDTYGHKVGDFVLQESAKIIKSSIRDNDIAIRYGGEEFLILINDRGNESIATEICERIRKNIQNHKYLYKNKKINVTVSIGLNIFPIKQKSFDEAVKIADKKLYISKNSGRNRVTFKLT